MADEITPRLNLVKPEVGGSADTWGDKWNENADKLDATVVRQSDLGTAATRDVTTSPTDTTPGRVMKVGDGGILARPSGGGSFDFDDPEQPTHLAEFIVTNATGLTPPGVSGGTVLRQVYRTGAAKRWYSDLVIANADRDGRVFSRAVGHDGTQITEDTGWREHYHTGNPPPLIGVGQTWQTMTGSRAANTIYTNTTDRPIFVAVTAVTYGPERSVSLDVGGNYIGQFTFSSDGSAHRITVSGLVPPGSTYQVIASGGTDLGWWRELR